MAPKNYVPADDGLATDAFLKIANQLAAMRTDITELKPRPPGGTSPGGGAVSWADNGDGTSTLTLSEAAAVTDNGDGTSTITI